jgi:hypothetical protein
MDAAGFVLGPLVLFICPISVGVESPERLASCQTDVDTTLPPRGPWKEKKKVVRLPLMRTHAAAEAKARASLGVPHQLI